MASKKLRAGIHAMPAEQYHADPCPTPSLSATLAKVLVSRSPAHARWQSPRLNAAYVREEKEAFDIGTATHDALLEGISKVEVINFDNWRTNASREQRDIARAKNRIPLLAKHFDHVALCVQMASAAIADCVDLGGMTLADGLAERSVFWEDVGTWCRCRPDWLSNDQTVMLDLKTTSGSAHPTAFGKQLVNLGYHVQAAFYQRGLRAVTGKDVRFVFLAMEIEPPFSCSFHALAPSLQAFADEQVERAIRLWADCLHKDSWPAYPRQICHVELPGYVEFQWEDQRMAIDAAQEKYGLQA